MKNTIILLIICSLMISCNTNDKTNQTQGGDIKGEKINLIFDTDIGNDIDDALALQMLLNYHKQNKINLLGISISKANPKTIDYIDGFCRFNDFPDMPLGYVYEGSKPDDGKYIIETLNEEVNDKKILQPKRSIKDSIPAGYKFIRNLLAKQPDLSVVLVVVGSETNIERLLKSEADEFSSLNGVDLVKQKVKLISIMGGHYGSEAFPEWNIITDLKAAQSVFSFCPVPIIASGWEVGNALLYPHKSIEEDFPDPEKNPLCVSYLAWGEMPYDRPTWDLTSVLVAVEPENESFNLSAQGVITIDDEGNSLFSPNENGLHQFLILDTAKSEYIMDTMVGTVSGKRFINQKSDE